MAYETKALLAAIAEIMKLSGGDMERAYKALQKIANTEGVILDPYNEEPEDQP